MHCIAAAAARVAPDPACRAGLLPWSGVATLSPPVPRPSPSHPLPLRRPAATELPFGLRQGPGGPAVPPLGSIAGFIPEPGNPPGPGIRIADPDPPAAGPEPAALVLFGVGVAGLRRALR